MVSRSRKSRSTAFDATFAEPGTRITLDQFTEPSHLGTLMYHGAVVMEAAGGQDGRPITFAAMYQERLLRALLAGFRNMVAYGIEHRRLPPGLTTDTVMVEEPDWLGWDAKTALKLEPGSVDWSGGSQAVAENKPEMRWPEIPDDQIDKAIVDAFTKVFMRVRDSFAIAYEPGSRLRAVPRATERLADLAIFDSLTRFVSEHFTKELDEKRNEFGEDWTLGEEGSAWVRNKRARIVDIREMAIEELDAKLPAALAWHHDLVPWRTNGSCCGNFQAPGETQCDNCFRKAVELGIDRTEFLT